MQEASGVKALFLVNALRPHSGAEIVLADYLRADPRTRAHVLLIGPDPNAAATFSGILEKERIHFIFSNEFRDDKLTRFFLMPFEIRRQERFLQRGGQIRALLERQRFDVVVFNNSLEAALFYRLFPEQKCATYIHDMVETLRPATKYCILKACESIPAIVTVSGACKDGLVRCGIAEGKIRVIHNGLEVRQTVYQPRENSAFTVGFVGATTKRKGFDACVKIVNRLSTRRPGEKVRLLVVTRSREDAYLRRCLRGLEKTVELDVRRDVPRENVLRLYREMRFVLVPSRNDPLPTVVIEAISQGVPVIGSNADGIPEMVRDRRLIFRVDHPGEALACVDFWLNATQEERIAVMRKNQEHIAMLFSNETKVKTLDNLLSSLSEEAREGILGS